MVDANYVFHNEKVQEHVFLLLNELCPHISLISWSSVGLQGGHGYNALWVTIIYMTPPI